jgi:superfamily II DNA or RNA helicase
MSPEAPTTRRLPEAGEKLAIDGELVTVRMAQMQGPNGVQIAAEMGDGTLRVVTVDWSTLDAALPPAPDGRGDAIRAITALWAKWMQWAIPRIRSAVLATTPLEPYAHQDEAVTGHMLVQPRMRLLLGDEPGTGKTIMTGMYLADGRRRGLIPGRVVIIVPAHLVSKWLLDLKRYFGIQAHQITAEMGRQPLPLREDVDSWVVSVDLYAHNPDVRRKLGAEHASWSLAVFDEAHRLTPTSQYLAAARDVAARSHHLLLLTATPHRGNEHFFRALFNLLDGDFYPWRERPQEYAQPLRPSSLHYLRRMKEGLRDHAGHPLFPERTAEVKPVGLTGLEQDAYDTVMEYADSWYSDRSTLARSIYGKRAASSLYAARQTLVRRRDGLAGRQRDERHVPTGYDEPDFDGANLDDDEAWERAEDALVATASRSRREELAAVDAVLSKLESVLADYEPAPSKWKATEQLLQRHSLRPGHGQLLLFTEFTDTAHWLTGLFADAGYSVEMLYGDLSAEHRDELQRRFLTGAFQVLVSTDAGGEGIDLQSAHVMVNWDIPWSLVRLEQRMGRLHRIGQKNAVSIYHLVAPDTREGRVQAVMLENFTLAARALQGRIFDLMDATAAGLRFNYARALTEAQRSADAGVLVAADVPSSEQLRTTAENLARHEDRSAGPQPDLAAAQERLVVDRIEAINPVMVESFVRQVANAYGWRVTTGSAPGILMLSGSPLPPELGGASQREVCADERARRVAWEQGAISAREVLLLGPAEESFSSLVDRAASDCEGDLRRGAQAVDPGSLSDYTLIAYNARLVTHDGLRQQTTILPVLVRYSGDQAFPVAWESVMNLQPDQSQASKPSPGARVAGETAAGTAADAERARVHMENASWVAEARRNMDDVERQLRRQLLGQPADVRRDQQERFARHKRERLDRLNDMASVTVTDPAPVGWIQVRGTGTLSEIGTDPDSEKRAIAHILNELSALGYEVDDRQTAGVGYDLYARHKSSREVRLVEVKGQKGDLAPVTLERNEWEQAQQRGEHYWLYIVVNCAAAPQVFARIRDPASVFGGTRTIQRHQIPIRQLREAAGQ